MSKPAWSKFIKTQIIDRVVKRDFRKPLNKKPTLLLLSPELLSKSLPEEDKGRAKDIFLELKKYFKKTGTPLTTRTKISTKGATYYIDKGNSFAIIASSFNIIRDRLNKASEHSGVHNLLSAPPEGGSPLDVGHVAGFGYEDKNSPLAAKITRTKEALMRLEERTGQDFGSATLSKLHKELEEEHMKYTAVADKNFAAAKAVVGKFSFIFTIPQSWEINRKELNSTERRIAKVLRDHVATVESSKPIIDSAAEYLVSAVDGKAKKPRKTKTKTGGNLQSKGKVTNTTPRLRSASGRFTNALKLQNILNLNLHDQIKANMGKGSSTQILNYRTGRFAESAKVLSVNPSSTRTVDIYFTFMRNPYDVFMPGGRLYKPGRDPRRIIGRSIRQLVSANLAAGFKANPVLAKGIFNE